MNTIKTRSNSLLTVEENKIINEKQTNINQNISLNDLDKIQTFYLDKLVDLQKNQYELFLTLVIDKVKIPNESFKEDNNHVIKRTIKSNFLINF